MRVEKHTLNYQTGLHDWCTRLVHACGHAQSFYTLAKPDPAAMRRAEKQPCPHCYLEAIIHAH